MNRHHPSAGRTLRVACTIWVGVVAISTATARPVAAQAPEPAVVFVDAVQSESLLERQRVTGEIRAHQRSQVAAEEPGVLLELPAREGTRVRRGEVLGRVKNRRLQLQLAEIEAQERVAVALVQQRSAQLEQRRFDLQVIERLAVERATNPKEQADARTAAAEAEATLAWAQEQRTVLTAQRELLEERIAETTIVAPFDGSVVAVHRHVGEWLAEGAALVDLVSTQDLEAWLAVPQRFFGVPVDAEHPVEVLVVATGQRLTGSTARVVQEIDSVTRNFALVVPLPAGPQLAHGMSVVAWVPGSSPTDYLTVAKGALLRSDVGSYLYVAQVTQPDAPALVRPVSVTPLFSTGARVAVQASGLQPGDLAIVEGNERLFPGAPVRPQPVPEPQGEPAQAPQRTAGTSSGPTPEPARPVPSAAPAAGEGGGQ